MRIAFGCDHRGLETKQRLMQMATAMGHTCRDFGCYTTERVDYPDIAAKVGIAVASGEYERGILVCDTGIGMSIAANKVTGIRAALCFDTFTVERCRLHNNANVLCLGIRTENLSDILSAFFNTKFEGGRHIARINKISALETNRPDCPPAPR